MLSDLSENKLGMNTSFILTFNIKLVFHWELISTIITLKLKVLVVLPHLNIMLLITSGKNTAIYTFVKY